MRHSVVFGCLVILLFAGVALCSLKPDTLKRTSSLPLIDKKEKAPPPLRRTKSSPAILSRSVLVNKKVTAAPSKKFKGKKTVTITGKLVWKKSLKKKTVFLQLASQTRSHTNALILRKKKKMWPFFVIAGGIMLFHAFTRKPVERKPKAFLSSVKDSVSDWKSEDVYTVKKDGATIKILKSNNKEFEIVADSPQRLKEVGKELEQVKEQVYKDIEKMETFKKAKKEMSKEVKENSKKDVALEMARLLDKYPRPPNDNDPFDAISTEDILLGLRYLSTVSEHVKDAFRQLDNEVKSRLSEMPEWQQRLYQMEDPLGGASFEDILDTTLKVTKTGKKVAKAMKETEEYFSPITETFEAGLESIDSLGKVIQSVEETMKEKTKDYDGKPLYFALADLNDYGMDWRDMKDTYGGGDDNGGGFDNNDDSTPYSPPEDDKGTISNEKIEVDNVDDGGAAAMEQIFDDSDKSNPFLN